MPTQEWPNTPNSLIYKRFMEISDGIDLKVNRPMGNLLGTAISERRCIYIGTPLFQDTSGRV